MIRRTLPPIMYGILISAYLVQMYVMDMPTYRIYIVHVLSYLSLAALHRYARSERASMFLSILLVSYSSWICYMYSGLTIIAAISPIFIYFSLGGPSNRFTVAAVHLIVLNIAMTNQELSWIAAANIMLLTLAYCLHVLLQHTNKSEQELHLLDQLRKQNYELDETRNRLMLFTQQVEGAAQAEERNRISQELHDELGHRLIRAKMMIEAAIHIVPNDRDKGMIMLKQIRDQLTIGLDEMRRTVKRMKPVTKQSAVELIRTMLEEIGREHGIRTELTLSGEADESLLYPSQQIVLYKNAKEAVSNALKHGKPQEVCIDITYTEHDISMSVRNDGQLPAKLPGEQSIGLGLQGMKERCQAAKGHLTVHTEYPFTVTTILPLIKQSNPYYISKREG